MTITDTDVERAARRFSALSDGTRLRILQLLSEGECCVCELQTALDAAQSRLSFHLKRLKEAGLVVDRRDGRWVYYSIDPDVLDTMTGDLTALRPEPLAAVRAPRCCE